MASETRVMRAAGRQGAALVLRLQPGADLIEAIESVCIEKGIEAAVVTSCIGSLREVTFVNLQPKNDGHIGYGHGAPYKIEKVQVLSAQGIVSKLEEGDYRTHIHGTVLDMENRVHGGHFVKGECPVILTVEITLAEIKGVRLVRRLDPEIGRTQLAPEEVQ